MACILIIDDEPSIRMMLRRALESMGHEVNDAPDGKTGVQRYREKPADLVITDIFMPEKEGLEVIMELKREFPCLKMIAMSGGSATFKKGNFLKAATLLGASHIFTKPFSLKDMIGTIQELVNSAQPESINALS